MKPPAVAPMVRLPALLPALAVLLAAGAAPAQGLTVSVDADLEFGRIAASADLPARVALDTDGLRTTDYGTLMTGGVVQPARFIARGDAGQIFQASVTAGPSGVSGIGLEGVTATCGPGSSFSSGLLSGCRLDGAGQATILVGATLVVDAGRGTTSLNASSAITVQVTY